MQRCSRHTLQQQIDEKETVYLDWAILMRQNK